MLVCENNVHKYVDWIGSIYIYVTEFMLYVYDMYEYAIYPNIDRI